MKGFKSKVDKLLDVALKVLGEESSVRYESVRGGAVEISAVFDKDWEGVDPDSETIISSNQPALGVKLADLPGGEAEQDDVFYIGKEKYLVWDVRPDGQGGATLLAHEL